MTQQKTISEQLQSRSGPVWRWIAWGLVFLNFLVLVQCLFSTVRSDLWADKEPLSQFTFLSIAIVMLSITPFARSIWLGKEAIQFDDIDEYERAVNQRVMGKAYRTTGIAMVVVLFLLMLVGDFVDIKLTGVSGGYWLMWFAQMFFSLPVIYAGFEPSAAASDNEED